MGFLKLKGESVMKLFRLSFGTQPCSSELDSEEESHEAMLPSGSFMLHLLSAFSAEDEEFWLSPVE
jgi:hypothetical protein